VGVCLRWGQLAGALVSLASARCPIRNSDPDPPLTCSQDDMPAVTDVWLTNLAKVRYISDRGIQG
jgi:hypothetical protein